MSGNTKTPTIEQATDILQKEQQARRQRFAEAYEKLCEKHGCRLVGHPGFTSDGRVGVELRAQLIAAGDR